MDSRAGVEKRVTLWMGQYSANDFAKFQLVSPPGRHCMPPVSICFTDNFLFFKLSPFSFDACTDRNADCCVDTADEKISVAKNW